MASLKKQLLLNYELIVVLLLAIWYLII